MIAFSPARIAEIGYSFRNDLAAGCGAKSAVRRGHVVGKLSGGSMCVLCGIWTGPRYPKEAGEEERTP